VQSVLVHLCANQFPDKKPTGHNLFAVADAPIY
jgi:hypothetical protein